MRLWEKIRNLTVQGYLRFTNNGEMRVTSSNVEYVISADALASIAGKKVTVLTTTKTVTAAETGTHFILNTITAFVTTLPAPVVGLEYFFHIGATEPTTTHTVVSNGSDNIINGNICSPDVDGTVVVNAADADSINFIASKALHGDFAHVWSNGTNWYLDGMCSAFDGMTTTQA
jgi:hypothetical protein